MKGQVSRCNSGAHYVFSIVLGHQWSSVAERNKIYQGLTAKTTPVCWINSLLVLVFIRLHRQQDKYKKISPPLSCNFSTLRNYVAIDNTVLILTSYSFTQLSPVQCLLCSQRLVYNINTSLMLRHVCANHENFLPRLNQAEASQAMLNCFLGNLPGA